MKRKMFRKLMAASLATVMAVSMAACGNGGGNSSQESGSNAPEGSNSDTQSESPADSQESETTPEEQGEVSKYPVLTDENGNVYDLGGMEIKIWSWFEEGTSNDDYGEAKEEWREWIQDTYNFTMTQETLGSWSDCHTSFVDYVTTGGDDNNYIFITNTQGAMISAMKQGLMYDVATLDCLDFSEKKFQQNGQCNLYSKGDSIYAFYAGVPEPRDGVYFNIRLLEQTTGMTADDLYDLQKSNEWTWEKWEEIMEKIMAGGDVDSDGVQDIYPWGGNRGQFVTAAIYSNGSSLFGMEDGKYVCNLEDPKTVKAMNWGVDMMTKYIYPQPDGTDWDYFKAAFRDEGKFVFLPEQAYAMTANGEYGNMEDEIGFLMFPYGPDSGSYVNAYDDNVWALPACYDEERAWKIMFAYNLWTEPIPGFEDVNPHLSGYYDCADNIRTVEETCARMSTEGGTVRYESFIPDIDLGEDLTYQLNPGADVAALIEAIKTKWYSAVEEANK